MRDQMQDKGSWDVLDAVTYWQERSKDVEQTLKLCFFLHFIPFSQRLSSFKNAVRSLSESDGGFSKDCSC